MDTQIHVDFDKKANKFVMNCPFIMVERVRSLPSRRWVSKAKRWMAPAIRVNALVMMESRQFWRFTEDAEAKFNTILLEASGGIKKIGFPSWYEWKTKPREKQKEALNHLYGLECAALFHDMGAGKTKTLIDLWCAMRIENRIEAGVLITPTGAAPTWPEQIPIHSPLEIDYHTYDVSKKKDFDRWLEKPHHFKVLRINVEGLGIGPAAYDAATRFILKYPDKCAIAADESTFIKNPATLRQQRACNLSYACVHASIMTGTPLTKGIEDLYGQYEFLKRDFFGCGDYYAFKNRYVVMGGYENKEIVGYKNVEELLQLVAPYTHEVRIQDVMDMPPKTYVRRDIEMTAEQKRVYQSIKRMGVVEMDGHKYEIENILERYSRYQEITSGFYTYEIPEWQEKGIKVQNRFARETFKTMPKIDDMIAVTHEIGEAKMIIWSKFKVELAEAVARLRKEWGHDSVVEYHGDTSNDDRIIAKDRFQNDPKVRWFVSNPQVGSMSLNLQAATYEYYLSSSFNWEQREQSERRAWRGGQEFPVVIIDPVCPGTIDELVLESHSRKEDLSDTVKRMLKENKDFRSQYV